MLGAYRGCGKDTELVWLPFRLAGWGHGLSGHTAGTHEPLGTLQAWKAPSTRMLMCPVCRDMPQLRLSGSKPQMRIPANVIY